MKKLEDCIPGSDEEYWVYNSYDVANTLRVSSKLKQRIAECGTWSQYQLDRKLAPVFRDLGNLGLNVNVRRRRAMAKILRDELKIRKKNLVDLLLNPDYYSKKVVPDKIVKFVEDFNPRSGPQVRKFLYDFQGLPPLINTKGRDIKPGEDPATSAAALTRLIAHGVDDLSRKFIDALLGYKAYEKMSSTYAGRIAAKEFKRKGKIIKEGELYGGFPMDEEDWGPYGKLHITHTQYKLQIVSSGRTASNGPNLQNVPERAREAICCECYGTGAPLLDHLSCDKKSCNQAHHCRICHGQKCGMCRGLGVEIDRKTNLSTGDLCRACRGDGLTRAPLNLRLMFEAPPGHLMFGADFDQLELRIYAAIARDQLILDVLADGRDPHLWNYSCLEGDTIEKAWVIYNKYMTMGGKDNPKVKQLRNIAKRFVFLMIYGGEIEKLYSTMSQDRDKSIGELSFPEVTDKDCRRWHKNWCRLHPWMQVWQNAMKDHANKYGFVASFILGRKRFFPGGANKQNAPVNHPIQSSGADFANQAIIAIHEIIGYREWSPLSGLNLQVHDFIGGQSPEERAAEAAKIVGECMSSSINGVPITAKGVVHKCWAGL